MVTRKETQLAVEAINIVMLSCQMKGLQLLYIKYIYKWILSIKCVPSHKIHLLKPYPLQDFKESLGLDEVIKEESTGMRLMLSYES